MAALFCIQVKPGVAIYLARCGTQWVSRMVMGVTTSDELEKQMSGRLAAVISMIKNGTMSINGITGAIVVAPSPVMKITSVSKDEAVGTRSHHVGEQIVGTKIKKLSKKRLKNRLKKRVKKRMKNKN